MSETNTAFRRGVSPSFSGTSTAFPRRSPVHAILESFFLVAVSEMGDKTQLLALVLTTRFRKPWAILAGILCATLLNHGLASTVGGWVAAQVPPRTMAWILAATFFGFGLWILIPDKEEELKQGGKHGAFLTTLVTFFIAEMGDKTQLATVALGARFHDPIAVTIGTTLGMMLADGLAVVFGERLTRRIPMRVIHLFACALFMAFGVLILVRAS